MTILIILISIYIIVAIAWLIRKYLRILICPICVGVFLTWLVMLIGMFTGKISVENFQLPTALLMGGSVVGLAYKLETKIKQNFSIILWKILFIPVGFSFVYSLVLSEWIQSLFYLFILGIIILVFLNFKSKKIEDKLNKKENVEKLLDQMKNCC